MEELTTQAVSHYLKLIVKKNARKKKQSIRTAFFNIHSVAELLLNRLTYVDTHPNLKQQKYKSYQ